MRSNRCRRALRLLLKASFAPINGSRCTRLHCGRPTLGSSDCKDLNGGAQQITCKHFSLLARVPIKALSVELCEGWKLSPLILISCSYCCICLSFEWLDGFKALNASIQLWIFLDRGVNLPIPIIWAVNGHKGQEFVRVRREVRSMAFTYFSCPYMLHVI